MWFKVVGHRAIAEKTGCLSWYKKDRGSIPGMHNNTQKTAKGDA